MVHNLSHPGVRATFRLVSSRFVRPGVEKNCKQWAKECLQCQKCKVTRHTVTPLTSFIPPTSRFAHVHIDLAGSLPPSEEQRYCLTAVDRSLTLPDSS
jgi:hypothetical protein